MKLNNPRFNKRNKLGKVAIVIRQLFGTLRDDDLAIVCDDYAYRLDELMDQWFAQVTDLRPKKYNPDRNYELCLLRENY